MRVARDTLRPAAVRRARRRLAAGHYETDVVVAAVADQIAAAMEADCAECHRSVGLGSLDVHRPDPGLGLGGAGRITPTDDIVIDQR